MKCPRCESEDVIKAGKQLKSRKTVQKYYCYGCKRFFIEGAKLRP